LVLSSEEFNQEQGIVVLAMITTAKRSRWKSDAPLNDWKEAGLKAPSMVRWKIFSLDSAMVFDRRGSLSQADRELIASSFKQIAAPFLLKTTTL
jgi:mRNA interferase MazF